ncbi:MAG TPA: rRNA maturation RNase YbeY [Ktedonobacteraceae bacterium]|nr:rRNA maturation RNase YbeY [Ktedonobacteraceae bacterium]
MAIFIDCSINLDEQDIALQRMFDADLPELVSDRTLRVAGIDATARSEQSYSFSLVITGDDEMQALNRQYRNQDKPTDVLSFPLLDDPLVNAPADQLWMLPEDAVADDEGEDQAGTQSPPHPAFITPAELAINLGDIVISWSTVSRQAAQAGHQPVYELLYLLAHGILHLVGYDDQTEAGYAAMVGIQEAVMREIDLGTA